MANFSQQITITGDPDEIRLFAHNIDAILCNKVKEGFLMGIFGHKKKRHSATARGNRAWWETAAEFSSDEMFYDPADNCFDPLGSYTGRPVDGGEPEQDADDL